MSPNHPQSHIPHSHIPNPVARIPISTLRINEIYRSIQGESTWAGLPCVFVRLTGCHLRCRYCDTEYAFKQGDTREIDDVINEIDAFNIDLVEITGGEPLLQKRIHDLMTRLCDLGKTVLVETSGGCDISSCDPRVIRILDLKTPGSGEVERNIWSNLDDLRHHDEIKFVITDRSDYEWARNIICEHQLDKRCAAVLLSPVFEQAPGLEIAGCTSLPPATLVEWILEDNLPVRMQLQTHKFVWDPAKRGV